MTVTVVARDYDGNDIPRDTRARYDFDVTIPVSVETRLGYDDALELMRYYIHDVPYQDWDIVYVGGKVVD